MIGADDLEVLGPYVPLASRLGRIAMELADGAAEEIVITVYGGLADHDARLLSVAALTAPSRAAPTGLSTTSTRRSIAAERGIEVREERSRPARDYTNLLSVELRAGGSSWRVAGTTFGSDHRPWLVNILGFEIELELAPLFVLCRYDDVPGVIGRVGTLFGEAGINIGAHDRLAQRSAAVRRSWRSPSTRPPSTELVERLRGEGFDDARVLELGPVAD